MQCSDKNGKCRLTPSHSLYACMSVRLRWTRDPAPSSVTATVECASAASSFEFARDTLPSQLLRLATLGHLRRCASLRRPQPPY